MNLQFNIVNIRLVEAQFSLNPKFNFPAGKPISVSSSFDIQYGVNNDNMVNVVSNVFSSNENQPFTYNISLLGQFKFEEMPDKDILDKIVHINCAAILFPYIRETIADLTRRAGVPPFHLSPVNLVNAYSAKIASQKSKAVVQEKIVKKQKANLVAAPVRVRVKR